MQSQDLAANSRPSARRAARLGLCVVVLAGAVVVSLTALPKSLWMDEYFTLLEGIGQVPFVMPVPIDAAVDSRAIWAADDPAGVRAALRAGDNGNMSSFVFLTHALVKAFGPDRPFALVVPTIAAYLVSVCWCFRLGSLLFSDRAGLIAAFLCAFHKGMTIFAVELRSYAPAIALCLIASECFLRIVGLNRHGFGPAPARLRLYAVLYAAFTLAALFTHYLSALVIAGHVVFAVLAVRNRRSWLALIAAGVVVVAVFVPVRALFLSSEGYDIVDAYNGHTQKIGRYAGKPASVKGLVLLIGSALFALSGMLELPRAAATAGIPVALIGLAAVWPGVRRQVLTQKPQTLFVAVGAMAFLATASIMLFLKFSVFPNAPRYQIFSAPFFALLIARMLDAFLGDSSSIDRQGFRPRCGRVVVTGYLLLVALTPAIVLRDTLRYPKRNDHLTWARAIGERADQGKIQRVEAPSILDCQMLAFYLGPERSVSLKVIDTDRAADVDRELKSLGLWHPLAVFMETRDAYGADGLDATRIEAESDADGVLRLRYGKKG